MQLLNGHAPLFEPFLSKVNGYNPFFRTFSGYFQMFLSLNWPFKVGGHTPFCTSNGMTLIITGPAGTGKSYFACALGDRACRNGIKVLYFTMNMLIENLRLVHLEGRETNFFRKLNAHELLIIDDFGMIKLDGQIQHDF